MIKSMSENHRLLQVDLTLTSDNDKDLRVLTDRIREEIFFDSHGWYRLGLVLLEMGQSDKAEKFMKVYWNRQVRRTKKDAFTINLGEPTMI